MGRPISTTDVSLYNHVHGGGGSAAGGAMGAGHPGSLSAYWHGCACYGSTFSLTTTASSGMFAYSNIPKYLCCFECGNFTANRGSTLNCQAQYWPRSRCSAGAVYNKEFCHQASCVMMAFTGFTNSMVDKTIYLEALYYCCANEARLVAGYLSEGVGFCSYNHCFNCCLSSFDSFQTISIGTDMHIGNDGNQQYNVSQGSILHGSAFHRVCRQGTCSHNHAGRLQRAVKYQNCLFLEPKHLREVYVYNM